MQICNIHERARTSPRGERQDEGCLLRMPGISRSERRLHPFRGGRLIGRYFLGPRAEIAGPGADQDAALVLFDRMNDPADGAADN
jgi:hypothetical protein